MKSTGYFDMDNKEIFMGIKYIDVVNKVDEIDIVEYDGVFYAEPEGLDPEKLSDVCDALRRVEEL
jgi:hypothetical protein